MKVNVALAYLPVEAAKAGTRMEIESFGRNIPAVVHEGPLHNPQSLRPRG